MDIILKLHNISDNGKKILGSTMGGRVTSATRQHELGSLQLVAILEVMAGVGLIAAGRREHIP